MKKQSIYIIIFLLLIAIQSCFAPSKDQIERLEIADESMMADFGIKVSGQITYQFYQKYGFGDTEEQLILIVKPTNVDFLSSDLPLEKADLKKLEKIDSRKFKKDRSILFTSERTMHADIRVKSKEFGTGKDKSVFHQEGKYGLTKTDSTETIFVSDTQSGLMYIESKK